MTQDTPITRQAEASRAVLLEILHVLGSYRDRLVLIGGWVPEILYPNMGHVGSLDVDLAVDGQRIDQDAYDLIRVRLAKAGYVQDGPHAGRFLRTMSTPGNVTVRVDLVTGAATGGDDAAAAQVQDLLLPRLRGVELACSGAVEVTISGKTPDGAQNELTARVVDVPTFLCLKAFALDERAKRKDAYDIWFCLRHFKGGPSLPARRCRPLLAEAIGRRDLQILRQKFRSISHVGPQWAADVASEVGEDRERTARDAFERAEALFRAIADVDHDRVNPTVDGPCAG